MKIYGLTHEQLGDGLGPTARMGGQEPRATFKMPITVDDVLNSWMIAYPFATRTQHSLRYPTEQSHKGACTTERGVPSEIWLELTMA
jgi:hypothetical protein